MTQYNTLNVKSSNSQLRKSKSGIKDGTQYPNIFKSFIKCEW